MGREVLICDDPLGELDEVVVDGAVGDPGAGVAQQASAGAADREAEGPEGDLGAELPLLEAVEVAGVESAASGIGWRTLRQAGVSSLRLHWNFTAIARELHKAEPQVSDNLIMHEIQEQ